jgi:ABC-2 type transport system permease protein
VRATTARKASRSGAVWGAVFLVTVAASVTGYATSFPTAASRAKLAASFEANAGIAALLGRARGLDTVAGFTAWRTMGVLPVIGAVWGLLTATRLLRGEEDAGRWDLLLAGPTTRTRAARDAVVGLAAGIGVLWAIVAVGTVAVGRTSDVVIPAGGALYLSLALATAPLLFLAVGVLAAEAADDRRTANLAGAVVLGASFLVRMVADSTSGLGWLRWLTPFGWVEDLRPLSDTQPLALVPIALFVAVAAVVGVRVAGVRDVGHGLRPTADTHPPRLALLQGPTALAVRLTRGHATGWLIGLASAGLVFGLVARSAADAISGNSVITDLLGRLGAEAAGARAYLGLTFLVAASLLTFMAAAEVSAIRDEELSGRLELLLAAPVSRTWWLVGRTLVAAAAVTAAGLAAGLAAWIGAATQDTGLGIGSALAAGVDVAVPGVAVLGIGVLVFGVWPRAAAAVVYAVVAWSFLVELVASVITGNRLLLDTSVLHHIRPSPAVAPDWIALLAMTAISALAVAGGLAALRRRDIVGA